MSAVERLQDRIDQLEDALGLKLRLPNEYGLTPLEMKILGLLVKRGIVHRDTIFDALYGALPESDQPNPKVVEVHICKIRRKLKSRELYIGTYVGVGYHLAPNTSREIKRLCEARSVA